MLSLKKLIGCLLLAPISFLNERTSRGGGRGASGPPLDAMVAWRSQVVHLALDLSKHVLAGTIKLSSHIF